MKKLLFSAALCALVLPATASADHHENVPPVPVKEVVKEDLSDHAKEKMEKHMEGVKADAAPHWGYVGGGAADKWGALSVEYHACKAGVQQSPINIEEFLRDDEMTDLQISYNAAPLVVANNGHTIQTNYAPGSSIISGDKTFDLLQFHFHTPSEHYLDGSPFPMEVHFVHKAEDGQLGVIGVMMKVGEHNPAIQSIWDNIGAASSENAVEGATINAASLLPVDKTYYKYDGSLTTPPCSEGVAWHVLKEPIEISQEQLIAFQTLFPVNARPVQPLYDRVVKGK